jgi:hypothetical protein
LSAQDDAVLADAPACAATEAATEARSIAANIKKRRECITPSLSSLVDKLEEKHLPMMHFLAARFKTTARPVEGGGRRDINVS